jgi:hypothetical protein
VASTTLLDRRASFRGATPQNQETLMLLYAFVSGAVGAVPIGASLSTTHTTESVALHDTWPNAILLCFPNNLFPSFGFVHFWAAASVRHIGCFIAARRIVPRAKE